MKIITISIGICLIFLGFIMCSYAQEAISLKYNFAPGTALNYEVKINGDILVEVQSNAQGTPIPSNSAQMEGDFTYKHEIVSVNPQDKSARLNVIYGKSFMNTIVNNQIIPNKDVPLLEGKVAELTVASNGEIKSFVLPKDLPESMRNADFRKMFVVFPDRPLRVGESWVKNSETVDQANENIVVSNNSYTTYTFLGIEKKGAYDCAKVKFENTSNSTTKSKNPDVVFDGKVEGKTEGIIYYNLRSGYVVFSDLNTKISNKVASENPAEQNLPAGTKPPTLTTTIVNTDMRTVTELLQK